MCVWWIFIENKMCIGLFLLRMFWVGWLYSIVLTNWQVWTTFWTRLWSRLTYFPTPHCTSWSITLTKQRNIQCRKLEWMFPLWVNFWDQYSLFLQCEIPEKLVTLLFQYPMHIVNLVGYYSDAWETCNSVPQPCRLSSIWMQMEWIFLLLKKFLC